MKFRELYEAPRVEAVVYLTEQAIAMSFNSTDSTEIIGRDGEDDL